MVIARIKELSLKTTLNCVDERVPRKEVGKSKVMAYGDKVPLLGAMRKVTSLNSPHPLIQQRPFCNDHVFSTSPSPADIQIEWWDSSMDPNRMGLNKASSIAFSVTWGQAENPPTVHSASVDEQDTSGRVGGFVVRGKQINKTAAETLLRRKAGMVSSPGQTGP